MSEYSRREFLRRGSQAVAGASLAGSLVAAPPLGAVAPPLQEYNRGGMRYRRLGSTDVFVSSLSFGSHIDPAYRVAAKHGGALNTEGQARRDRQLSRAFDYGVNMVDTYENAGQWEPVARLVAPRRDKVLVSICRQFSMFVGENIDRAAKLYGHTDLYRIYIGDIDGRVLEDWDVLRKAKKAGKVRAIGISTHKESVMLRALTELEGLDYIMFPYNFIHARADYSECLPQAIRKGVGLIAIKPLAAGSIVRLDPKANAGSKPENPNIVLYRARNKGVSPAVVAELTKSLNQAPGESLCGAAMRFVYSRPFITSAMPGMFQDHELTENYAALTRQLKVGRADGGVNGDVLDRARRTARLHGSSWLPRHYRWLDQQWLA